MTSLVELLFRADTSQLDDAKKSLADLAGQARSTSSEVDKLGSMFEKLASPIGLAITGIVTLTGTMIAMTLSTADGADALDELSQATGRSSEELQILDSIAKKNGASLDGLLATFDKVAMGMSKSSDENSKFSKALEYIGVSATDANGKLKESAEVAKEAAEYWDKSTKSASDQAAMQVILGGSYKSTVVALNALKTAEEEKQKAQQAGAIIDGNLKQASDEYKNTMQDMGLVFQGLANSITRELLPRFTGLAEAFINSATNGGLVSAALTGVKVAADGLGTLIGWVGKVFIGFDATVQIAGRSLGAFFAIVEMAGKGNLTGIKDTIANLKSDIDDITAKAAASMKKISEGVAPGGDAPGAPGVANPKTFSTAKPKKAGIDEEAKEAERLRQLDIKGWVAYADAVFKEAEDNDRAMAKLHADFWKNEDKLKETDLKGWVAYADAVFKEAEENDKALAKMHDDRMKRETRAEEEKWRDVNRFLSSYADKAADAFVDMAMTGKSSFKDMISSMLADLARMVMSQMFQTLLKQVGGGGGLFGAFMGLFAANGAAFDQGGAKAFAAGGVVDSPTAFSFAGGTGLMGEAGPEAIMPLSRGSNGRLGVQVTGSGGGSIVQNNAVTVNVQGGQTNAETGAAVNKAVLQAMRQVAKDELNNSRRPGGALNPMTVG